MALYRRCISFAVLVLVLPQFLMATNWQLDYVDGFAISGDRLRYSTRESSSLKASKSTPRNALYVRDSPFIDGSKSWTVKMEKGKEFSLGVTDMTIFNTGINTAGLFFNLNSQGHYGRVTKSFVPLVTPESVITMKVFADKNKVVLKVTMEDFNATLSVPSKKFEGPIYPAIQIYSDTRVQITPSGHWPAVGRWYLDAESTEVDALRDGGVTLNIKQKADGFRGVLKAGNTIHMKLIQMGTVDEDKWSGQFGPSTRATGNMVVMYL